MSKTKLSIILALIGLLGSGAAYSINLQIGDNTIISDSSQETTITDEGDIVTNLFGDIGSDFAEVCQRPNQILPHDAVGCFNNWYIYIINGAQGGIPQNGGCSILFHELLHARGLSESEIKQQYPNELCAVV